MFRFTIRNSLLTPMNYKLKTTEQYQKKNPLMLAMKRLVPLLANEKSHVYVALAAMIVNSVATLLGPIIIAQTIDGAIRHKDLHMLLLRTLLLACVYIIALISN